MCECKRSISVVTLTHSIGSVDQARVTAHQTWPFKYIQLLIIDFTLKNKNNKNYVLNHDKHLLNHFFLTNWHFRQFQIIPLKNKNRNVVSELLLHST